jgi:hypothetical protein
VHDLTGLPELLPGDPDVTISDAEGDGESFVRVTAEWPGDARAKFDVYDDHVVWRNLMAGTRRGLYGELCEVLPGYFAAQGLDYMQMTAASGEAAERLLRRGEWREVADGAFRWAVR